MMPRPLGRVAQLVEQLTFNQLVVGSIPTAVTPLLIIKLINDKQIAIFFRCKIALCIPAKLKT